jgi:hypothetical protein
LLPGFHLPGSCLPRLCPLGGTSNCHDLFMAAGDPPVPDDVVYAWSPRRFVLATAAVGAVAAAVGWFSASLLFSALAGRPGLPNAVGGVVFVGVYTLLFTVFSCRINVDVAGPAGAGRTPRPPQSRPA